MKALVRQLQSSLELAQECARLMPLLSDRAADLGRCCLDHLAHAEALCRLALDDTAPPADEPAALDLLSARVAQARAVAARECLAASDAREIELLGMIAACLATHEELLRA